MSYVTCVHTHTHNIRTHAHLGIVYNQCVYDTLSLSSITYPWQQYSIVLADGFDEVNLHSFVEFVRPFPVALLNVYLQHPVLEDIMSRHAPTTLWDKTHLQLLLQMMNLLVFG